MIHHHNRKVVYIPLGYHIDELLPAACRHVADMRVGNRNDEPLSRNLNYK